MSMGKENMRFRPGDTVVVDTSALLIEGVSLLSSLRGVCLVIPSVVVSELEANRGKPTVGFLAREWLNLLESLRLEHGKDLVTDGVPYQGVIIRLEPNHKNQGSLPKHLQDGSVDSTVLAVAVNLHAELFQGQDDNSSRLVLLTNDTPMKIHALYVGIDSVSASEPEVTPFTGRVPVHISEDDFCEVSGNEDKLMDMVSARVREDMVVPPNCVLDVFISGQFVASFLWVNNTIRPITLKERASNVVARNMEQSVAVQYLKLPSVFVPVVSLAGGAGCGKTLLTLATGLEQVKAGDYKKVLVFRSLHELGKGQEMGFLPGSVDEKMAPWAGAIDDALEVIARHQKRSRKISTPTEQKIIVDKIVEQYREIVEVSPITYLRGRSISDTFMVIEEAQNFSRREILNILSRAGAGTKVVLTWDATQVDSKYILPGDHAEVWKVVDSLKGSELFTHVCLEQSQRSPVAQLSADILRSL